MRGFDEIDWWMDVSLRCLQRENCRHVMCVLCLDK
jgi:hypothetical protein